MEKRAIIDISVSPKSSKNRIVIDENGTIKVYLTAPPVDGKANAELLAFLSKRLKIPKSYIEILHGDKSKKKRLSFSECSIEEIIAKIRGL